MRITQRTGVLGMLAAAVVALGGCFHAHHRPQLVAPDVPHERQKVPLPEYVIEPPDLLQIDLLYAVALPPYKIQPLDVLVVTVANPLENEPLSGQYPVEPDGTIVFPGRYRNVKVAGLTVPEAKEAVQKHLDSIVKDLRVTTVAIAEGRGVQLVRGPHLVRPDGTVSLGTYGTVQVSGRTVSEAKALIEAQLQKYLQAPEVVVNVIGYNSKLYYIIFDFGGAGQQVVRLPVTGNDTVLDAISQVNGLTAVSDPRAVWVARSAGPGEPDQILPVDWAALTCRGRPETNYQLAPGDRIVVKAYPMTTVDATLARIFAPIERLFGVTLLGTTTYRGLKFVNTLGVGGGGGF